MNAERINQQPEREQKPLNPEELMEHHERLREDRERAGEKSHESADDARHEALERAKSIETERQPETEERMPSPAERRTGGPNKRDREASFNATMTEVRTQMSAPSRAFSKVIHNPAVEKVSEVAGNTIARPSAILSGAVFAFLLTLAVYLIAKNIGQRLSGFETIGAFTLGWILGLVYDFLKVMITGRK